MTAKMWVKNKDNSPFQILKLINRFSVGNPLQILDLNTS